MYYGAIIQYSNRYIWGLEDHFPENDMDVRNMFQGHRMGRYSAIIIRDEAFNVGEELKRHFRTGKRDKTNYAVMDYTQRIQLLGSEKGDTEKKSS